MGVALRYCQCLGLKPIERPGAPCDAPTARPAATTPPAPESRTARTPPGPTAPATAARTAGGGLARTVMGPVGCIPTLGRDPDRCCGLAAPALGHLARA